MPEVWNIYSKLLSQSKNNRRRSPQIYSADSIEKTLKQPVIFKKRVSDTTSAKKKKTYLDATAEVYPDEDGTNDTKIAQRLRKQVERSKKRKADMGNLKNSVTNLLNSSLE